MPDEGDRYAEFRAGVFGGVVAERDLFAGDPAMVPEVEWQSRWFRGDFGTRFTGENRERIEVVHFGWWNRAAGPDFLGAVVAVNGESCRGAIELDTDARDWERHGHAGNPAYEGVVLHLFFRAPERRFFTRTAANREVSQVRLDAAACDDGFSPAPAPARIGRCAVPLEDMPERAVWSLLHEAARHRASARAAAVARNAALHGWDEAWFQSLAEALGYHANRQPMRVLAQRVPLASLREAGAAAEACLFGHAGFLEAEAYDHFEDERVRAYLREMWRHWWAMRPDGLRALDWKWSGIRPANHPHRRLGALAALVARWPDLRAALEASEFSVARVVGLLEETSHPFWSEYFTLQAEVLPSKTALIGRDRARDFTGNTALPVRAARDPALWAEYEKLGAGSASGALRRAALRLLGRRGDAAAFQSTFAGQQGLLQVYRDFCLADDSDCAACPFPEQLRQWRA